MEEQFAQIVASHPLGLGKPEDVAEAAAVFLQGARWITGTTLRLLIQGDTHDEG